MKNFILLTLLLFMSVTGFTQEFTQAQIPFTVKNFLKNPGAETGVTGVKGYADAAAASPVDGTGGTVNVTFDSNATSPISGKRSFVFTKDAVNRQGQGWSMDFTIDESAKTKVLQIAFDYRVNSGTYADNDVSVWVYDVTNSQIIQPAPYQLKNVTGTESLGLEFQSSSSTSYRLIFHVSSTSASAYSLKFDNVSVARTAKLYGSPVNGSVPVTLTSNFTNSTTTAYMTRVGDRAYFEGIVLLSGTPGAADLQITLPAGYAIDTNKVANSANLRNTFGIAWIYDSSPGLTYYGQVRGTGTTSVQINRPVTSTAGQSAAVDNVNPFTFASGDSIMFRFDVPIVGWGSTTIMSSDADTRVVAMIAGGNPANTSANGIIIYPTVSKDTHGAYNSSTGEYTVPVSGYYRVTASVYGTFGVGQLLCAVNGSARYPAMGFNFSDGRSSGSTVVFANVGDKITVYNSVALSSLSSFNGISIERISGPSQVAASETVGAFYRASPPTGTLNGGYNTVTFGTKIKDSHGAYTSGSYTVPTPGLYDISAQVSISGTFAANTPNYIAIFVDGVQVTDNVLYAYGSGLVAAMVPVSIKSYPLLQGQVVTIRAATSATSPSFQADANRNYFSIMRSGNY